MDFNKTDKVALLVLLAIDSTRYARNLKIQKLIYIYEREVEKEIFRDSFEAANYGPFSKKVGDIINILLNNKFIKDDETTYSLTALGKNILFKLKNALNDSELNIGYFLNICNAFQSSNSDRVVKYVYKNYPELLGKSIIADGLFYEEDDYDWIKLTKNDLNELKKDFQRKKISN